MEVNNIVMTGLGRAMSDLDCADGELSVSHNIIRDNGAMRPIWVPEDVMTLNTGETLVYVHRTSAYKNYIVRDGEGLKFFTDEDMERKAVKTMVSADSAVKLTSMGNTLLLTGEDGLEYILYKDGGYKVLGKKPPELDMSFGLRMYRLNPYTHDYVTVKAEGNTGLRTIDEEYRSDVSLQIAAKVNEVLAEAETANWFTSTFFVRWAYRMYGGLYMASPPVMMPLNGGIGPLLEVTGVPEGALEEFKVSVYGYKGKLQYRIPDYESVMAKLKDWEDVVDGVEIYVTRGTTRYNQDGLCKGIVAGDDTRQCVSYGQMEALGTSGDVYGDRSAMYLSSGYYVNGMYKTEEEYRDELLSNGVFYKLKSYSVDELQAGIVEVEMADNAVSGIVNAPVLGKETDEYLEHDVLYPQGMHVYNSRLNLFGVEAEKYNFPLSALTVYTDGYDTTESDGTYAASLLADGDDTESGEDTDDTDDGESDGGGGDITIGAYVKSEQAYSVRFVVTNEGQTVEVTNTGGLAMYEAPLYLFYPDNGARKAIIERLNNGTGVWERAEVSLTSHPNLQGCHWFGGFSKLTFTAISESERMVEEAAEERRMNYSGKVYTSEVSNPFVFPLGGINSIGTGKVVGISTVTEALSQGQFGQFPLYVFSTEGVWAMEVASNGLYSSVKPVSRDVCINGDSITQTDNAVVFVTEKGVMLLDGSNVTCISDMMDGRSLDVDAIYGLTDLMRDGVGSTGDFMDYAREARMAYDYANGRLLLYREGMAYCYVFSLSGKTWATLGLEIGNAVADYPDVYVQKGIGVKNLSTRVDYDSVARMGTLVVTRPVKLGDDGFKTVMEMVVRGAMDRSRGAVLLWGSHDGLTYVLIKAVTGGRMYRTGGSGYRYFRIGIVGDMCAGETVSMVSVGFRRKYANRLR